MSALVPQLVWRRVAALRSEEEDEFGGYLYGGGQEVGEVDEDVALAQPFELQQAALLTVERPADDADPAAVHVGGDLAGAVVAGGGGRGGGGYEAVHVAGGHCHGGAVRCALDVTVLESRDTFHNGIKHGAQCAYEEQIGDQREFASLCAAAGLYDFGVKGGEYLEVILFEKCVCVDAGIGPFQVAHHVPFRGSG